MFVSIQSVCTQQHVIAKLLKSITQIISVQTIKSTTELAIDQRTGGRGPQGKVLLTHNFTHPVQQFADGRSGAPVTPSAIWTAVSQAE